MLFTNRPSLTPGQIFFMRFVGYRTPREWVIDDDYRHWTKQSVKQRFSLRQLFHKYGGLKPAPSPAAFQQS